MYDDILHPAGYTDDPGGQVSLLQVRVRDAGGEGGEVLGLGLGLGLWLELRLALGLG